MKKETIYTYLGDNGIINSTIYLPGVNSVLKYALTADEGKILVNDAEKAQTVIVPEREVSNWKEIPYDGQE